MTQTTETDVTNHPSDDADLLYRTEYADTYAWGNTVCTRLHTCPACGQRLGRDSSDPTVEPANIHLAKHDPEDFPL